jgi:hypothetical protein
MILRKLKVERGKRKVTVAGVLQDHNIEAATVHKTLRVYLSQLRLGATMSLKPLGFLPATTPSTDAISRRRRSAGTSHYSLFTVSCSLFLHPSPRFDKLSDRGMKS